MNRETIDKLANLPSLFQEIKDIIFSTDKDDWASRGLVSVDELDVLYQAEEAQQDIYEAGESAEAGVSRPDYRAHWPKETRDLANTRDEANGYFNRQHDIDRILRTFEGDNPYSNDTMMRTLLPLKTAAGALHRHIIEQEGSQPEDIYGELSRLTRSYEAKQRRGTKLQRINHDLGVEYDRQKRDARDAATAPLKQRYMSVFEQARDIRSIVETRKRRAAGPLVAKIKRLLLAVA